MRAFVKIIILFFILFEFLNSSKLRLKEMLDNAQNSNFNRDFLIQKNISNKLNNLFDVSSSPFEINLQTTKVELDNKDSGSEYSIGILKNINFNTSKDKQIVNLSNDANIIDIERYTIKFKNNFKKLYHRYCLNLDIYESLNINYKDFLNLYDKKEIAYKYDEISKIDLMRLKSAKSLLFVELNRLRILKKSSRDKILLLSGLKYDENRTIDCKDINPISGKILIINPFRLSKQAYDKRLSSAKKSLERYDNNFESIEVFANYEKDIDSKKYTIGVSIPLPFTSNKLEHKKALALSRISALNYQYKQITKNNRSLLLELKSKLKNDAINIKLLTENYLDYKITFLPLVEKSYKYGEISIINYLLERQKLFALSKELYQHKLTYYNRLFDLYTLTEKKD
jgi:hypothetical protein